MRLRRATVEDLALLQGWDAKAHVIAATGADDEFPWEHELPRDVTWRELLIAQHEDRPVGVLQIVAPRIEETHRLPVEGLVSRGDAAGRGGRAIRQRPFSLPAWDP